MWLMTTSGFFSIVRKYSKAHDEIRYHVRSRSKKDLENLLKLSKVNEDILVFRNSDYPHRICVQKSQYEQIMQALMAEVEYSNFKSEVGRIPDQRHKEIAYHKIWAIMGDTEEAR
ncbi:MAG: hypothetical protein HQM11_07845 [SAR324 cluster bacterium]|nr:hypothetical protein [SAR324 cluster bacterium]